MLSKDLLNFNEILATFGCSRLARLGSWRCVSEDLRAASVESRELVPGGLHRLAVASPRRQKLDERILARVEDLGVKVAILELDRAGGGAREGGEEDGRAHLCAKHACQRRAS